MASAARPLRLRCAAAFATLQLPFDGEGPERLFVMAPFADRKSDGWKLHRRRVRIVHDEHGQAVDLRNGD